MRRGTTIAELLVALVLASVVFGLVTQSVIAQRRHERTIAGSSQGASAADETIGVLTSVLDRVSSADTVRLRGDTAIDLDRTIGGGLACAVGGDSLILRDSSATSWWESPPDSSDGIDALVAGQWLHGEIVSARTRTAASGGCSGSQRVLRMLPAPTMTSELPLVRVTRRTRFMVYRGGDGAWWFGERTCSASPPYSCAAAQPVSGPLINARALTFAIDTAGDAPVVTASATAGKTTRTVVRPLRP
jgi:hypothetical protein